MSVPITKQDLAALQLAIPGVVSVTAHKTGYNYATVNVWLATANAGTQLLVFAYYPPRNLRHDSTYLEADGSIVSINALRDHTDLGDSIIKLCPHLVTVLNEMIAT